MPMQSYSAEIDIEDDAAVSCGSCSWKAKAHELVPIDGCALTPGDPSPAGRCPECDALAYVNRPDDDAAAALRDLLDQLQRIGIYVPGMDEGQWADAQGLSFARAEAAVAEWETVCYGAHIPTLVRGLEAEIAERERAGKGR